MTVLDDFIKAAEMYPFRAAMERGSSSISYGDLLHRSRQIAEKLRALHVEPKDVIAIYGTPSFGLFASVLGVFMAGGVILLVDPNLPVRRKIFLKEESGTGFLIHAGEFAEEFHDLDSLEIDPFSASISRFQQGRRSKSSFCSSFGDPAYLFATSGTTGKPRLVVGRHAGLEHFIDWQREKFAVGPEDRVAQLTGLSFDVVLRDIFLAFTAGAVLCLPEHGKEGAGSVVFPWLKKSRVSRLHTVPAVAQSWLNLAAESPHLSELRTVFFAGEPLTDVLVNRWRQAVSSECHIINLYGPTETTLAKCFYEVPARGMRPGIQPVGSPLPNCRVLILNPELRPCASGEPGQISIATEFRSYGYLNAPEENARRFVNASFDGHSTPVFLTGDMGRLSSSGELEIMGRLDNQVKINGIRVELEEISAIAAQHPGVASAVALARQKSPAGDKSLSLYWVPRTGTLPATEQELRDFLSMHLPRGVVPSSFVMLDCMPLTANGKIDRSALPLPEPSTEAIQPATEAERQLLPIWKNVLQQLGCAPGPDFFAAGGTSIGIAEIQLQINARLGVDVSLAQIFRKPRFQDVAKLIAQAQEGPHGTGADIPRALVRDDYPVMTSQRAYIEFHLIGEYRTWNNITTEIHFDDNLSPEALASSLDELVRRHQNLRLTFFVKNGHWVQRLNPPQRVPFGRLNLLQSSPSQRQSALKTVWKEHTASIFSMDQWPLFKATLINVDEKTTKVLFTIMHLVSDAFSQEIIARELKQCVQAYLKGVSPDLPRIKTEFLDYVMWTVSQSGMDQLKPSLEYWLSVFADYNERLELPLDGDPSAGAMAAGYKRWMENGLGTRVQALCQRLNCSPFVVFFSVFAIVLHRLSGRKDIILKTVSDGRPEPFLRALVGNFATVVHVRSRMEEQQSFIDFTANIQSGIALAVEHQQCQFLEILDTFGLSPGADRIPLASIFLNPAGAGSPKPDETNEEIAEDLGREEKCDIMAYLRHSRDPIEIEVHYRRGLYSLKTIRRIMDDLEEALKDFTNDPYLPVAMSAVSQRA